MIDVHCHLNFYKFENDFDQVIHDAFEARVTAIVNTGTSVDSSKKAVKLAQDYENLYAIVGIHPHHADKTEVSVLRSSAAPAGLKTDAEFEGEIADDWLEQLEILAKMPKVIGIGEIGMDYWNYRTNGIVPKDLQEDAFRKQIELSIKLELPLQIHTRLAWDDTLSILSDYKKEFLSVPGMFHCFSGSTQFAKKVLDAGFYVGFDGNITYPGIPPGENTPLSELVEYVPLERIVTETDSPFLTPQILRGERNTPKNVIIVGEEIARLKNLSFDAVKQKTVENVHAVFNKLV